jgi:methylated-DNA-[protein]-cysteine S-methyltransferase
MRVGEVVVAVENDAVVKVEIKEGPIEKVEISDKLLREALAQLHAYFSGKLTNFDLPLDLSSGTTFRQEVWRHVQQIPYGNTISYGDIARSMDNPGAIRAIGSANGANPIPIIVPCHRVIGSDGSLTGYVYGMHVKRQLLALENPDKWGVEQLMLSLT